MKNIVSQMSRGQGHELLNKLEAAGLTDKLAQRVIDSKDNALATKAVKFIEDGEFETKTSQKRAREIMGCNMLSIEDVFHYLRVTPTKQQVVVMSEIPFSETTLKQCKDTHILVAVFPLSILEIRSKVMGAKRLFYEQSWYNEQPFAKDKGEAEWCLVKKTPVENSMSKTWDEQQALLADNEETLKARVVIYTAVCYLFLTSEWLLEKIFVRCMDVSSNGRRISVGSFDLYDLCVGDYWASASYDIIGLSSARKRIV